MKDADIHPTKAADAVARITDEQGLQPAEPPKPLLVIAGNDIHLVCWQAIIGSTSLAGLDSPNRVATEE